MLFLARLQARKRPVAFVQAADIALRSMPGVRFDIYGPDEGALGEVEQEIARLTLGESVRYHGSVNHEQAQQITAAADVYVLPSVREPFPMSLLEALAVGTPVVCTTSTGISDELDRRGAAVVTDGSPEELAKGIIDILSNDDVRVGLVQAGDSAVSEVFSIDAVAAVLEQVYTDAARRRRGLALAPGASWSRPPALALPRRRRQPLLGQRGVLLDVGRDHGAGAYHRAGAHRHTTQDDGPGGHPRAVLQGDRAVVEFEGGRAPLVTTGAQERGLGDADVAPDDALARG